MIRPVQGFCPQGCGETLVLDKDNRVVCWDEDCSNPDALHQLISDPLSQHHVVVLLETEFLVVHPLRERVGELMEVCDLHRQIKQSDGPPRELGRYRAELGQHPSKWVPLP